nr:phospholipase-like protein [Tanacetum cinerariifolium]
MDKDSTTPNITIKARIGVVKEILEALTPTQVQIFKKTCFGHWLDIGLDRNNQLLVHMLLTCMVDSIANELSFIVLGKRIRFRRHEFCLVTGLRFGHNIYINEWVKNMSKNPFSNRMFPHIEAKHPVKLGDVIDIFDKMRKGSLKLEDDDAVKICLSVLLEHRFLGHQSRHKISNEMLKLVDHLSNCWNIFPWGSYIYDFTYPHLRDALSKCKVRHDDMREKGEEIRYTVTGFVWVFMIWILEAILATHSYAGKEPTERILRDLAWKMILSLNNLSRCHTLSVDDNLAPPLKTLTPTLAESEADWWKASLEYFEAKHVQSEEEVSEQLKIEKDGLSEQVQTKKKRKTDSSRPTFQDPTYDQLMMTVTTLEGTVTTLTKTVLSLQGTIGDACVSTLTQIVSSLQGIIHTLESRLLVLEDTIDTNLDESDAAKDTHLDVVTIISIPMTTTETLKDTIYIDALDAAQETGHTKDELQFIGVEKGDKPNYELPDLSKIKRKKYPIYSTFEKKKIDCYLDYLPKGVTCETSFWDILYPGGQKAEYLEQRKLDGLHINAFIELMMRKRPCNAQWTLRLSELVTFHIDSHKLMSMVSVVDALRATIDGTNPRVFPNKFG